jgi:hypothetical protein
LPYFISQLFTFYCISLQAEIYIRIIKGRLYKFLRANFNNKWPTILPKIVFAINHTENKALNYLVPAEVNTPEADPIIREERRKETTTGTKKKATEKNFAVGSYVYADFPDEPFTKSFDFARGMVYVVSAVDTKSSPYLYSLKELNEKPLKKKYYSWQLRAAPDPYTTVLPVEKILKTRVIKGGKKEYYVKWLFYDNSYNQWVPKNQLGVQ